jgi:hypothetical protein
METLNIIHSYITCNVQLGKEKQAKKENAFQKSRISAKKRYFIEAN